MDFDGDGILDLISGSYDPGEIYLFRGEGGGRYGARETITDRSGRPVLRVPDQRSKTESFGTCVAMVDWDGDGDLDLLLGGPGGSMVVRINEGTRTRPQFSTASLPVLIDGKPLRVPGGYASPVVADWDGDGLWDILSGSADGGVYWFRNTGKPDAPEFEPPVALIPPHAGTGYGEFLDTGEAPRPGIRSRIAVADHDRDGRLDILVGDFCTNLLARGDLSSSERKEMADLRQQHTVARAALSTQMARVRSRIEDELQHFTRDEWALEENQERWRNRSKELLGEPAFVEAYEAHTRCAEALRPYLERPAKPGVDDEFATAHGYVWHFLRK